MSALERAEQAVEPGGCRWCGLPERGHAQRWKPPVGWHKWTQPTQEQRLARMRARRANTPKEN